MERKKLKFMDVNEEDVLDREQMRNIMAGCGCGDNGQCTLDCNQNEPGPTYDVSDCKRSTVTAKCGCDLSNAKCSGPLGVC